MSQINFTAFPDPDMPRASSDKYTGTQHSAVLHSILIASAKVLKNENRSLSMKNTSNL